MAKKIKHFTDEDDKKLNDPRSLPEGVTEDDLHDVDRNPMRTRPGQAELATESDARDSRRSLASTEIDRLTKIPTVSPDNYKKGLEGRIRSSVAEFKKEPPGPKKEAHRRTAWTLAEGIKRDSSSREGNPSDLTPGRRTRVTFVDGLDMPCVTPGPNGMGCNNTVPYQGPKVEAEGSPVTAGITTCSGGKCDIPAAVAPRSAER